MQELVRNAKKNRGDFLSQNRKKLNKAGRLTRPCQLVFFGLFRCRLNSASYAYIEQDHLNNLCSLGNPSLKTKGSLHGGCRSVCRFSGLELTISEEAGSSLVCGEARKQVQALEHAQLAGATWPAILASFFILIDSPNDHIF